MLTLKNRKNIKIFPPLEALSEEVYVDYMNKWEDIFFNDKIIDENLELGRDSITKGKEFPLKTLMDSKKAERKC